MKHPLKTLLASLFLGLSALTLQAQPAPRILVVDMAELYDGHYKTEEQNAKLQADEQRAQVDLERLNTDGNRLVSEYTELVEQSRNPALSNDAKTKMEQDAQAKLEQIQAKQNEVQNFRANIQRSLQTRIQTFRDLMLEEISKTATEVAKQKGATLLVDKSGPSLIGISSFIYVDDAYDITAEVMGIINRDRPATSPASATSAAPAASGDTPEVRFPGAK